MDLAWTNDVGASQKPHEHEGDARHIMSCKAIMFTHLCGANAEMRREGLGK